MERESKNSIREALLYYMKENPFESRKNNLWTKVFVKPVYISALVLCVIFIGGGVLAMQANNALPGDTLYPVKIGFNEKVLEVLAFSDSAKIDLKVGLTERRLEEAEKLAIEGKITDSNQQEIKENLNKKVKEVAQTIDKLNEEKMYDDASKIASSLEASMKAHGLVLEKISEIKDKNGQAKEKINSLITNIDGAVAQVTNSDEKSVEKEIHESNFSKNTVSKIAEKRLKEAEEAIAEVKKVIKEEDGKISQDAIYQVINNLSLAEEKIGEGKIKMAGDEKDYRGAIFLFKQALLTAKQSKYLLEATSKLGVDFNIKIENRNEKE
jgi:tetratricopeptide (TPR) repeat protein